jgi:hypothetical protein
MASGGGFQWGRLRGGETMETEEKGRGWVGGTVTEERRRRRRPVGFNGEAFSSFESTPKGGNQMGCRFQERRGRGGASQIGWCDALQPAVAAQTDGGW